MPAPVLSLKNIALTFGGTPLLTDAGFDLMPGDRLALVGRNGSGKSTLLKIASGQIEPDEGEIFVQPGTTRAYLAQEPDFGEHETVEAFILAGLGEHDNVYRVPLLLEDLGLKPDQHPKSLSGGEGRRAALIQALVAEPDILLLDEPTNHLDLPAIEWLEAELKPLKSALVLISHDRAFLNALSRATLWLDRGVTRRLEQGFEAFEPWRDKVLEEEEVAHHKLGRKIAAEEHWLRYGVTARRKRNVRRLGEMHALKAKHKARQGPRGTVQFSIGEAARTGSIVIDAEGVSKSYGKNQLIQDLDIRLMKSDRLAIVGANGTGKTTLIKSLLGELDLDSGKVKVGSNVEVAMLDQSRARLDPTTALADALTGGGTDTVMINGKPRHVVSYMQDFLFAPEQMRTPLRELSGGERARLMLARALALPSNLLVLDEPTNDLDIETLDLLQELVADYPGTVILVSHDRDFIDRVATTTLIAEGDGRWTAYAGGYADMVSVRGHGVRAVSARTVEVAKPKPAPATKPAPAAPRKKLSFKQSHALKTLPEEMAKLAAERDSLNRQLSAPDLYTKNPEKFAALSEQLDAVSAAHDDKESQWLELEILREELEAG